jgi:hypothetical protein
MAFENIHFVNSSYKLYSDSFQYVRMDGEFYVYQNVYTKDEIRLRHKLPNLDNLTDYAVYY